MISFERSTLTIFALAINLSWSNAAFLHTPATSLSLKKPSLSISHPSPPPPSSTTLHLGDFFNFGKKNEPKQDDEPPSATTPTPQTIDEEEEPADKLFSFFFGKKEDSPMGMSRFGPERFPEQYPATTTEWASPVDTDDAEMSIIRPFLKNTNLETRALRLTYDANRDGWDPLVFHSLVDRQGGAVVLCTTRRGWVGGGYNPTGWVGYGEARGSIAAFLFRVGGGVGEAPGIKLRKVGGPGLAQIDNPENGPSFGADSLVIPLAKGDAKLARSKLGSYYERMADGGNSLFGKDASVQLKDLKIFHGVYAEGEYVPFTDAEPFALY